MASPQQQPTAAQEAPIIAEVLAWISALKAAVAVEDVVHAISSGSAQAILYAMGRARKLVLDLMPVARAEGERAVAALDGAKRLELRFDIFDPRFLTAVEQQGALAITRIDAETRSAVVRLVQDGYRNGWNPRVFAPMVAETVGLTVRDSLAVANQFRANVDGGMPEGRAQAIADRTAARYAKQRGVVVARTETMRAHNIARREGWLQAQRHGLFAGKTVYEEWVSVQTDPNEICFQLNGTRTPLGQTFDGEYPPQHPQCRCVTVPVFE